MGLLEILESIKKKLAELLGACDQMRSTLEEAEKLAKEIEGMVDDWLQKIRAGVARNVEEDQE